MLKCSALRLGLLVAILGLPAVVRAQTPTPTAVPTSAPTAGPTAAPAEGQAFGALLSFAGTTPIDQSDTGPHTAPNPTNTPSPDAFDVTAAGATVGLAPLADVVTGPSRTRGCSSNTPADCANLFPTALPAGTPTPNDPLNSSLEGKQFVFSEGGNATSSLLIGAAAGQNVLDVVSDGSAALVACAPNAAPTVTANAHIDALVIGGNPVPIPGSQPPNTSVASSQTSLLILNEQFCPDPAAPAGTTRCIVNALHAQVISNGQPIDYKVSGATAEVTSPNCVCTGPNCCIPNFGSSIKTSVIEQADRQTPKSPQVPAIGDPIRFKISAVNSAAVTDTCTEQQVTATNVRIVDRIPKGVTVDPASITVQMDNGTATPTTGTIASCGSTLQFPGCEPEPVTDASRQCLTVNVGSIGPGHTTNVSFIATVNSTATGGSQPGCNAGGQGLGICNTAVIESDQTQGGAGTPRTSQLICPSAPVTNPLRTTGGGGCSLGPNPSRAGSAGLPVLVVCALLAVRRWRMRHSRR